MDNEGMRIGNLADRVGLTTHVLRVWEKRYGLLRPVRSVGGYRLYTEADEKRVRAVIALRDRGVPVSDAVNRVLAAERLGEAESAAPGSPDMIVARLLLATMTFDEPDAQAALDQALALPLATAIGEVLMPLLRAVGERWADGTLGVAQEHFSSGLIRRRLAARTSSWGHGTGPLALLSCCPGEHHDIPLMAFGLLLGASGWRVSYLGQDTPANDIVRTADLLKPDLIVLSATRPGVVAALDPALAALASRYTVAYGGAGIDPDRVAAAGAHVLPDDVVQAAAAAVDLFRHGA